MTGISQQGKEGIFSPCNHIQTSSGTHPASYPMGTGDSLSRGKIAEA